MLNRIEPLRNELKALEDQANENTIRHEEVQKLIKDLEASITKYKEEYALLIGQAQAINADLAAVEAKVHANLVNHKYLNVYFAKNFFNIYW